MKADNNLHKINNVNVRASCKHTHHLLHNNLSTPLKPRILNLQALQKQKGVILFIGLIFLIMLSLLGLNAAQMSILEERMSGNVRSRDLAFQSAEAALKYVEQRIVSGSISSLLPAPTNSTIGTITSAGLRAINICLPNTAAYWNGTGSLDCNGISGSFTWTTGTTGTALTSSTLNQVASQALYVVERYPNDTTTTEKYRVTVRGIGGDADTVVILQAMYSYVPS